MNRRVATSAPGIIYVVAQAGGFTVVRSASRGKPKQVSRIYTSKDAAQTYAELLRRSAELEAR